VPASVPVLLFQLSFPKSQVPVVVDVNVIMMKT